MRASTLGLVDRIPENGFKVPLEGLLVLTETLNCMETIFFPVSTLGEYPVQVL